MYCSNCGAKIADGSRFCRECGAVTAPETANPEPVKMNRNPMNYGNSSMPSGGAYPGGAYPGGNSAPGPDYDSRTVLLDVDPAVFRNDWETSPSSVPGNKPGATPYPVQPAGAAQYGNPYGGRPPVAGRPQKKKRNPVVVMLIVLGVLLAAMAVMFVIFKVVNSDSTDQNTISETDTIVENAAATAEQTTVGEAQSVSATASADNGSGTNAGQNNLLTDAQAQAVKEKTVGFWNSEDKRRFIGVTRMDDGLYYFTAGFWYSEADLVGYLQQPITGDSKGTVSMHLFFEGYVSEETGYSMPSIDDDMQFDLSRTDEGVIRWKFYGDWMEFHYGGLTMEEAMPSYEEIFGEDY